ncbi:MAG: hypothetical protein ACYCQJ_15720 [Nitrososphaerales archaeon]
MIIVIPLAILFFRCWARTIEVVLHGVTDFGADSFAVTVAISSLILLWILRPTNTIYH